MTEGRKVIAPLRGIAPPISDAVRPVPYLSLQSMFDAGNPHGMHYYWRSRRLPGLSDEVIGALHKRAESVTSPFSHIVGLAVGGAVTRVGPDATAVGERAAGFEMNLVAAWPPPDPDGGRHTAWVREGWEALRPYSTGVLAHFLSDEGEAGVQAAYGERLKCLTALKDRHDPTNFFRLNANIAPSREPGREERSDG